MIIQSGNCILNGTSSNLKLIIGKHCTLVPMKGFPGIGLLLCLIVPFLASWQFLSGRIREVKEEVAQNINTEKYEEEKVLLKFTSEDSSKLYWEHSREFEYKGEMYDVIRFEKKGDTIWYWCYWDQKETKLKRDLAQLVIRILPPTDQQQKAQDSILQFFKSLYPNFPKEIKVSIDPSIASKIMIDFSNPVSSFEPHPPFHPPELS